MGVILTDLAHADDPVPRDTDLMVNWWNWRPTIELIRSMNLLDDEVLERLGFNAAGAKVTEEQARRIGEHLRAHILPAMTSDARVRLDLRQTTEPDDFKLHRGAEVDKNYGATYEWLEKFAAFCMSCKGFSAG